MLPSTDSGEAMTDEPDQALTVRDVALLLNVTEKTIYRLAQKRELPGFKVAGAWCFMRQDINRWVEAKKTEAIDAHELSRQ